MSSSKKIRVLIVDDSAVTCRILSDLLADPAIEVVGTARDPYEARDKILELRPDVLTLDIEMPRMDGLTFLRILQKHHPLPVIVISALTRSGSRGVLEALAVDVVAKPHFIKDQLINRVKGAAAAQVPKPLAAASADTSPAALAEPVRFHPGQLILLGASTGGTEALKFLLTQLPAGLPGIGIVQHIPPQFSKAFAERLNELCAFEVREAAHGDRLQPGLALIAPGDFHMTIEWKIDGYRVALNQQPPIHHVRPAVDILFDSVAACAGQYSIAALLTGMGSDGAQGMQKLKLTGAHNIAQNEETCVVYGMPRAAVDLGVVDQLLPLDKIPAAIIKAALNRARSSLPKNSSNLSPSTHSNP
jgi:two-component system chemotaxis response regulator CheB